MVRVVGWGLLTQAVLIFPRVNSLLTETNTNNKGSLIPTVAFFQTQRKCLGLVPWPLALHSSLSLSFTPANSWSLSFGPYCKCQDRQYWCGAWGNLGANPPARSLSQLPFFPSQNPESLLTPTGTASYLYQRCPVPWGKFVSTLCQPASSCSLPPSTRSAGYMPCLSQGHVESRSQLCPRCWPPCLYSRMILGSPWIPVGTHMGKACG